MALDALIRIFTIMSACVSGTSPAVSLSAPGRVLAMEGSCLIIPCSFSPSSGAQTMDLRLIRTPTTYLTMLRKTVFSSQRGDAVHPDFRDRTALAGNISAGDCSVSISTVRRDDQNTYELQIRERGQRSWPAGSKVNISVTGSPEPPELTDPGPVKEGQRVVLNCSARIVCPSDRPRLLWKWERGNRDGSSVHGDTELQRDAGQLPVLRTSLTFTVPQHTNPRVRCELEYPNNNRRSSATREILVHFPPRDVSVQVLSAWVRDGGNALLTCSCKADPPVSEYQWWSVESGNTLILPKRTPTIRIYNVSRDTRVQCSASNRLGRASSRPTRLNVQYAPVILSSSSCDWDGSLLSCSCVVDSNPRPAITWSVNGTHVLDGFNDSFSYVNHTLTATLSGISDTPLLVECYAVSALGNDSHLLYEPQDGALMWTVILTAGAVFLLLLLLFVLLFYCCCCRRKRRRRVYRPPAIHPEHLGLYQERMPLYINCCEVTNVYSNGSYQLIYQNCTPLFVRSKQMYKRQRRGARRQRAQRETPIPITVDSDTAIYVEVI